MSNWLEEHLFINHVLGGIFYISFYLAYCCLFCYFTWVIFDNELMPNWCKHLIVMLTWVLSLVILCIGTK